MTEIIGFLYDAIQLIIMNVVLLKNLFEYIMHS